MGEVELRYIQIGREEKTIEVLIIVIGMLIEGVEVEMLEIVIDIDILQTLMRSLMVKEEVFITEIEIRHVVSIEM